jgi:hypothetical protein
MTEEVTLQVTKQWICDRCGYATECKSNLVRHLRRQYSCEVRNKDILIDTYISELTKKKYNTKTYDCDLCLAKFNSRSNKSRHRRSCKSSQTQQIQDKDLQETNNQVLVLLNDIKERLDQVESRIGIAGGTTLIDNRITNNNTINISVNSFGSEDTSYLTKEFLSFCLLNPRKGMTSLIENIHYNKDYPENQNIRCKSLKQNIFERYVEYEWKECDASNTLDELIKKGYRILNAHYTETFMNDPTIYEDESKQRAYERFRYLSDTNCIDYFAVKRELRLLVKDRTVYLLESPSQLQVQ